MTEPGEGLELKFVPWADAVREARKREPNCGRCGKPHPEDPNLHHVCTEMIRSFQDGLKKLSAAFKKMDARPGGFWRTVEIQEEAKVAVTMNLDCMGFDPDEVLKKLQERAQTLWVSPPQAILASGILGWPKDFRRVKGGIEVDVEFLEAPLEGSGMINHAALAVKGLLDLSIAGSKKPDGSDFTINRLTAQPTGKLWPHP